MTYRGRRLAWETALYRLYDEDGRLLYVGISISPETRIVEHSRTKPWWPDVAYKSVEWFQDGELAREIETAVISGEKPLHNYVNNKIPVQHCENADSEVLRDAAEQFMESRRRFNADRDALYRLIFDSRQSGMTRAEITRTTGLNPQTIDAALTKENAR